MGEARRESYRAISLGANDPLSRAAFKRAMGSDMGALRDQTVLNIRDWAGRRKQKPVRSL